MGGPDKTEERDVCKKFMLDNICICTCVCVCENWTDFFSPFLFLFSLLVGK